MLPNVYTGKQTRDVNVADGSNKNKIHKIQSFKCNYGAR